MLKDDPLFQEICKFRPIEVIGCVVLVLAGWAMLVAASFLLS